MLDSEGDSELGKGVFAHQVPKVLGEEQQYTNSRCRKKVDWIAQKGVTAVAQTGPGEGRI